MLTEKGLIEEIEWFNGVRRKYLLPNGYGLSLINAGELIGRSFAWEAAMLNPANKRGYFTDLSYSTPLTSNVESFKTDEEANAFIEKAFAWAEGSLK